MSLSQQVSAAGQHLEVARLQYARRKLVVLADDAVVFAERLAAQQRAEGEVQPKQALQWGELAAYSIASIFVPGFATIAFVKAAIELFNSIRKLRTSGVEVLTITRDESSRLSFPPGHPLYKVLYVGHPASSTIYYTTAQFHRLTFEHKFSEAIRLLMSLGATKMEVEHISGWSRDFSARLNVPLSPTDQVDVSGGSHRSARNHLLYRATFRPKGQPRLPDGMVWFNHEPTWQQLAEGRLYYGLEDFSLVVTYEDDFGVNAHLKGLAVAAGLELGGNFEDHQATTWRIAGKFAPNP
jgi:hypothetical protein